jgi:hypothetical protein
VNVSLKPRKDVVARAAYHIFWADEVRDALYNAAGVAGRRSPVNRIGREIGHESDLTIRWTIDVHQAVLLGWSHFWASDFIQDTGRSDDPDLFYVQYEIKF